jgi:hypothetical protein
MSITFQKRQKEMKRQEKQRAKAEKRAQKKEAKRAAKEAGFPIQQSDHDTTATDLAPADVAAADSHPGAPEN